MKRSWFLFFFRRSISQRKGRVLLSGLSVVLAVGIIIALTGLSFGIRQNLGSELRAYGANVLVTPAGEEPIDAGALEKIRAVPDVDDVFGQFLTRLYVNSYNTEAIGIAYERLKALGWRVTGALPGSPDEVLVGANLSRVLGIRPGDSIVVSRGDRKQTLRATGIYERGGPEDNALLLDIRTLWEFSEMQGKLSLILAHAASGRHNEVSARIGQLLPDVKAGTFRQVAVAEERLLHKIELLMLLVTLAVLFASAVTVSSTVTANVLERREEIGLMKALGATRLGVGMFYITEALLIGITGGLGGLLCGAAAGQVISQGAFRAPLALPWYLPLEALAAGFAIALVSSYFPVRDSMRTDAAVILRGE